MSDEADENDSDDGLYVTDAQIIRKLGFSPKVGYRILQQLELPHQGRAPYPQRDPLFRNKRFWPAVLQWHLDYHRVRAAETPLTAPSDQPRWLENFNAPASDKAPRSRHARPAMAGA